MSPPTSSWLSNWICPNLGEQFRRFNQNFHSAQFHEILKNIVCLGNLRLSWDQATAQAYIVEHAEDEGNDPRNVGHIYYWEVTWPRMFSNRDYVCGRRSKVFKKEASEDEDVIVLYTKSTEHSTCPKKSKAFRYCTDL